MGPSPPSTGARGASETPGNYLLQQRVLTMLLSIVVPVYKEEKNVPEFLGRIVPILGKITEDFEIIFAMDPSRDRTEEVILEHRQRDERVKLLKFSRRYGQPMATLAGLQYSAGEAVVVMDVDLQDPPELVLDMVAKWREGYDVVMAQRRSREGETLVKRVVAYLGYKVINRIAEVNIPPNTGDFRLMSRRVVGEVCRLKECHGFLRGLVGLVGFRQTSILFDRPPRFAGHGNYNRFLGFAADRPQRRLLLLELLAHPQHPFRVSFRRRCLPDRRRLFRHEVARRPLPDGQPDHRHPHAVSRRGAAHQCRHPWGIHRPDL